MSVVGQKEKDEVFSPSVLMALLALDITISYSMPFVICRSIKNKINKKYRAVMGFAGRSENDYEITVA